MSVPSLIERWFPAPIIGAESLRERGASSALPPINFLHVWWARRPLTSSRAAVVASLLPAWPSDEELSGDAERANVLAALKEEFPGGEEDYRAWFVRFMGILGDPIAGRARIRQAKAAGIKLEGNGYGYPRAFTASPDPADVERLHRLAAVARDGTYDRRVLDSFAGGGSIPFEAVRFGCDSVANELNPVASAILGGTIELPTELGSRLPELIAGYGGRWVKGIRDELEPYFPLAGDDVSIVGYVWAHAIPCPETGFPTPLIPNSWLANTDAKRVAIEVEGDRETGEITRRLVTGERASEVGPTGTYKGGKATSLFTGQVIDAATVRESAQNGGLSEILLAVVVTRPGVKGRSYRLPTDADLAAIDAAEAAFGEQEMALELDGLLPTEEITSGHKTDEPRRMGLTRWRSLFTKRQLLGYATALRALQTLVSDARAADGDETARAVALTLYFAIAKGLNYNGRLNGWHPTRESGANVFDRHDFAFKYTFAELDAAHALWPWAVSQVSDATGEIVRLLTQEQDQINSNAPTGSCKVLRGSATSLPSIASSSVDALVTDPPGHVGRSGVTSLR